MISGLQIVCEYARTSGTALYTLVGTRVGKGRLPAGFTNTQKAIVIQSQALTQDEFDANVQSDRYVVKCYGGSANPDDAETVFIAAYTRLHKAHGDTASGGIVMGELETGTPMVDPDTGWPLYVAIFRIQTS